MLTIVSLIVMPILARAKRRVGRELGARSVEADSQQTQACVYLSAMVLAGLTANTVFEWWWADPIAALGTCRAPRNPVHRRLIICRLPKTDVVICRV